MPGRSDARGSSSIRPGRPARYAPSARRSAPAADASAAVHPPGPILGLERDRDHEPVAEASGRTAAAAPGLAARNGLGRRHRHGRAHQGRQRSRTCTPTTAVAPTDPIAESHDVPPNRAAVTTRDQRQRADRQQGEVGRIGREASLRVAGRLALRQPGDAEAQRNNPEHRDRHHQDDVVPTSSDPQSATATRGPDASIPVVACRRRYCDIGRSGQGVKPEVAIISS